MAESESVDPIRLEDLAPSFRAFDPAAFQERYGVGFLVHHGLIASERKPVRPQHTVLVSREELASNPLGEATTGVHPSSDGRARTAVPREWFAYPIRATGRSPYPRIVTVGRTRNNDIVLPDVAISKFHAFFKEEGGHFFLQDAGSRNGTFLKDTKVPDAKHGKPVKLKPGVQVRFGSLDLAFMLVDGLRDLASKRAHAT